METPSPDTGNPQPLQRMAEHETAENDRSIGHQRMKPQCLQKMPMEKRPYSPCPAAARTINPEDFQPDAGRQRKMREQDRIVK